ncbi:hypothetical protein JTL59_33810, partial [Pseudomonas aeruginosa]|nr:hypothetical protein [Pseudomonas aeruginosa]
MDAGAPGERSNQHGEPRRSLEGLDCLGMCRQRRRTWGKHGPGAVCLPAGNGTAPQPFSCAAGKKKP